MENYDVFRVVMILFCVIPAIIYIISLRNREPYKIEKFTDLVAKAKFHILLIIVIYVILCMYYLFTGISDWGYTLITIIYVGTLIYNYKVYSDSLLESAMLDESAILRNARIQVVFVVLWVICNNIMTLGLGIVVLIASIFVFLDGVKIIADIKSDTDRKKYAVVIVSTIIFLVIAESPMPYFIFDNIQKKYADKAGEKQVVTVIDASKIGEKGKEVNSTETGKKSNNITNVSSDYDSNLENEIKYNTNTGQFLLSKNMLILIAVVICLLILVLIVKFK